MLSMIYTDKNDHDCAVISKNWNTISNMYSNYHHIPLNVAAFILSNGTVATL